MTRAFRPTKKSIWMYLVLWLPRSSAMKVFSPRPLLLLSELSGKPPSFQFRRPSGLCARSPEEKILSPRHLSYPSRLLRLWQLYLSKQLKVSCIEIPTRLKTHMPFLVTPSLVPMLIFSVPLKSLDMMKSLANTAISSVRKNWLSPVKVELASKQLSKGNMASYKQNILGLLLDKTSRQSVGEEEQTLAMEGGSCEREALKRRF